MKGSRFPSLRLRHDAPAGFRCGRAFLSVLMLLITACAGNEYRFEQLDEGEPRPIALEFDGVYGIRDGDAVTAEARFSGGMDSAAVRMVLHLGPPAVFRSGTYRADIAGTVSEGPVESTSLTYLGGQNSQPSVGGVFLLKDAGGATLYRVRIPPTELSRQAAP